MDHTGFLESISDMARSAGKAAATSYDTSVEDALGEKLGVTALWGEQHSEIVPMFQGLTEKLNKQIGYGKSKDSQSVSETREFKKGMNITLTFSWDAPSDSIFLSIEKNGRNITGEGPHVEDGKVRIYTYLEPAKPAHPIFRTSEDEMDLPKDYPVKMLQALWYLLHCLSQHDAIAMCGHLAFRVAINVLPLLASNADTGLIDTIETEFTMVSGGIVGQPWDISEASCVARKTNITVSANLSGDGLHLVYWSKDGIIFPFSQKLKKIDLFSEPVISEEVNDNIPELPCFPSSLVKWGRDSLSEKYIEWTRCIMWNSIEKDAESQVNHVLSRIMDRRSTRFRILGGSCHVCALYCPERDSVTLLFEDYKEWLAVWGSDKDAEIHLHLSDKDLRNSIKKILLSVVALRLVYRT